jgi:hypothetical protein
MAIRSSIREEYRKLYSFLKSKAVVNFIAQHYPHDAGELLSLLKFIPHPKVASEWDIYEVAKMCVSGRLEYLYELIGDTAKRLLNLTRSEYPYVEQQEYRQPFPLPPERPEVTDIAAMLLWTNQTLARLREISLYTKHQVDIIMKGQCPFCHGDLVTYIKGQELRLRCKNRPKPECSQIAWKIGTATQTSP